jgi:hypothetical protein
MLCDVSSCTVTIGMQFIPIGCSYRQLEAWTGALATLGQAPGANTAEQHMDTCYVVWYVDVIRYVELLNWHVCHCKWHVCNANWRRGWRTGTGTRCEQRHVDMRYVMLCYVVILACAFL